MPDTPVPEAHLQFAKPRVAAAMQRARRALVARPSATAPDLAQGSLFPLLHAFGVDIYDLEVLRSEGEPTSRSVVYRLHLETRSVRIELLACGEPLPKERRNVQQGQLELTSNGRKWCAFAADDETVKLDLFDEEFPLALRELLHGEHQGERTGEQGEFTSAAPLERITLEEVRHFAAQVRHLRGKLQAWFEGQPVEVTSRSAFYYVLAELALRHGREDAIPGEDLLLPSDEPPQDRRVQPLGRSGRRLLVDHDALTVEGRTLILLEALGLGDLFTATQRGKPYPSRGTSAGRAN
ncbi:MAG: hypothetical protein WD273_01445 [Trueperaceae bacterium]